MNNQEILARLSALRTIKQAMELVKAGATPEQLGNWKPTAASQVPITGKNQGLSPSGMSGRAQR
jgi:hypothetical protein